MYEKIERVTGRPLEIVREEEPEAEQGREPSRPIAYLPPESVLKAGYCWVSFDAWEAEGIPRDKVCEKCIQQKRQHLACLKVEAVA